MNGRIVLRVLFVLAVLAGVAGVGVYAYNMGVAQGLAGSASLAAPAPGVAPHLYYGRPFFFGPFGFGFAGCLFPLLFVFLALVLLRGLFWRGHWVHGHHAGYWERGVPPMFEEWHRKAHEPQPTQPADK
jgi:hypothetical protein